MATEVRCGSLCAIDTKFLSRARARGKVEKDNQNLLVTGDIDVIASIYRHERASKLPHDTAPGSYISASSNKWPSVAGCCGRARHPVLQADGTCDRSLLESHLSSFRFYFASLSHILQSPVTVISHLLPTPEAHFAQLIPLTKIPSGRKAVTPTKVFIHCETPGWPGNNAYYSLYANLWLSLFE